MHSWPLSLIITHLIIYRQRKVQLWSNCLKFVLVEMEVVSCPLLLGLQTRPCQCSNFQMSLLRLPHFFLITLSHIGINETHWEMRSSVVVCSFFTLSFSFPRKLTTLFYLFSSMNLCLSLLSGLYPSPKWFFFWITIIGFSMPCSLFPKPFSTRAPLPSTCLMPEWVTSDSFGTGILPLPLHTWHWQILEIWMNIPMPSRLFPHMVFLIRWQQSCPLWRKHRLVIFLSQT